MIRSVITHIALLAGSCVVFCCMTNANADTYTAEQWRINAWGTPKPIYTSSTASGDLCGLSKYDSLYFKVMQRRGGSAELVLPNVLDPGKAYMFDVLLRVHGRTAKIDLFYRRNSRPYDTAAIRTVAIGTNWTDVRLIGIYTSSSRGSVRIAIRGEGVGLCVGRARLKSINVADVGAPRYYKRLSGTYFGIHLNKLGVHHGWPRFNPAVVRLWDTGTTWALLQPDPGRINWATNGNARRLDYYVRYGRKRNSSVNYIMTLGMTPFWAGTPHRGDCNNSFYGKRSCTMPVNINDWRAYVRQLALRYRGKIKIWEVWNEADIWSQWDESPRSMLLLVRAAYQELKSVDPSNIVIGPNVTGMGMRFLNDFLVAGGAKYIDGVSIHVYFGRSPDAALSILRNVRELLISYKLKLPIWNTETGVSCNSIIENCRKIVGGKKGVLSGDISLARGLLGCAALGISNVSYYTWEGAVMAAGGLPLVRPDFVTPTSTGLVMVRIRLWIDNSVVKFLPTQFTNLTLISIERDGAKAFVAWSRGSNVSIRVSLMPGVDRIQPLVGPSRHIRAGSDIVVGDKPVLIYGRNFLQRRSNAR